MLINGTVELLPLPHPCCVVSRLPAAATAAFRSDTPDEEDEDSQPHQRTNSSSTAAAGASAAAASSSSAAAAGAEAAAVARLPATPRLRTRLFAAELLLSLFAAVGTDERHRHPRPKYGNAAGGGAAIAAAAGDAGEACDSGMATPYVARGLHPGRAKAWLSYERDHLCTKYPSGGPVHVTCEFRLSTTGSTHTTPKRSTCILLQGSTVAPCSDSPPLLVP